MMFLYLLLCCVMANRVVCLPDQAYQVVWNCATTLCASKGVPFNVTKFGILQNPNDERKGKYMTLFPGLGNFPSIDQGVYKNGGIPQLGDLAAHIGNATLQVEAAIPDKNYSGLAVIDYESWRPLYEHNFDTYSVYQKASIDLVKQRNPTWTNQTLIKARAKAEWDGAARLFFESALAVGVQLRPHAYWGFYEFPRCYMSIEDYQCNPSSQQDNDELMWLYEASTALFPSIYLNMADDGDHKEQFPVAYLREAMRVSAQRSVPLPVFPYTQYLFAGSQLFLTEEDLLMSYLVPMLAGARGTVIWGGTATVANVEVCQQASAYVQGALGPVVSQVTQWAQKCSDQLCNGHGRCVTIEREGVVSLIVDGAIPSDIASFIKCSCDIDYSGKNCSVESKECFHC